MMLAALQLKKYIFTVSAVVIGMVTLTGCAGREKPVLSLTAKQAMQSSKVVMINDHKSLDADITGSNATQVMGGGLLWALADIAAIAEQRSEQETLIEPIEKQLQTENLLADLKDAIAGEIGSSSKFVFAGEELAQEDLDQYISEYKGGADAIAILTPHYRFSEDFAQLKTSVNIRFIPVSSSFKKALKVSEAFDRAAVSTSVEHYFTPEETVSALANNPQLKEKARESVPNAVALSGTQLAKQSKKKFNEMRLDAKKNNAAIWSQNSGAYIKQAVEESTTVVAQKLAKKLPVIFPDQYGQKQ